MALPKAGRLNATNVQKLQRTLRSNPRAREEAVAAMRRSFPAFLRQSFDLTPHDVAQMKRVPNEVWDLLGRASIVALRHGGNVMGRSEERRVGKECRSRWS